MLRIEDIKVIVVNSSWVEKDKFIFKGIIENLNVLWLVEWEGRR